MGDNADERAEALYTQNSKEHERSIKNVIRPRLETWRAGARALECARAGVRCAYSGTVIGEACGLQVDHVVSLELVGELMWQASRAHCKAKGWHLPWPLPAAEWVHALLHDQDNLLAVTTLAHMEKTAASAKFVGRVGEVLDEARGHARGGAARAPVLPLLGAWLQDKVDRRARKGNGHARLLPGFADLVARRHASMGMSLLSEWPAVERRMVAGGHLARECRHARILVQWLACALGAVGGQHFHPTPTGRKRQRDDGE
jgi:hypothetical protein